MCRSEDKQEVCGNPPLQKQNYYAIVCNGGISIGARRNK